MNGNINRVNSRQINIMSRTYRKAKYTQQCPSGSSIGHYYVDAHLQHGLGSPQVNGDSHDENPKSGIYHRNGYLSRPSRCHSHSGEGYLTGMMLVLNHVYYRAIFISLQNGDNTLVGGRRGSGPGRCLSRATHPECHRLMSHERHEAVLIERDYCTCRDLPSLQQPIRVKYSPHIYLGTKTKTYSYPLYHHDCMESDICREMITTNRTYYCINLVSLQNGDNTLMGDRAGDGPDWYSRHAVQPARYRHGSQECYDTGSVGPVYHSNWDRPYAQHPIGVKSSSRFYLNKNTKVVVAILYSTSLNTRSIKPMLYRQMGSKYKCILITVWQLGYYNRSNVNQDDWRGTSVQSALICKHSLHFHLNQCWYKKTELHKSDVDNIDLYDCRMPVHLTNRVLKGVISIYIQLMERHFIVKDHQNESPVVYGNTLGLKRSVQNRRGYESRLHRQSCCKPTDITHRAGRGNKHLRVTVQPAEHSGSGIRNDSHGERVVNFIDDGHKVHGAKVWYNITRETIGYCTLSCDNVGRKQYTMVCITNGGMTVKHFCVHPSIHNISMHYTCSMRLRHPPYSDIRLNGQSEVTFSMRRRCYTITPDLSGERLTRVLNLPNIIKTWFPIVRTQALDETSHYYDSSEYRCIGVDLDVMYSLSYIKPQYAKRKIH